MTTQINFDEIHHQPLRVPSGWRVIWNTLYEMDLSDSSIEQLGYLHSSSIFTATHTIKRLTVDVSWFPQDCIECHFLLKVFYSNPICQNGNIDFTKKLDWDNEVFGFETSNRLLLVDKIEDVLQNNAHWVTHLNTQDGLFKASSATPVQSGHQSQPPPKTSLQPKLQALRIVHGWEITLNDFIEEESLPNFLGNQISTTLLTAIKDGFRLKLEVRCSKLGTENTFHIAVLYARWPRSPNGKRLKTAPLHFDENVETLLTFETLNYAELIHQLNAVFKKNNWPIEYN